MQLTQTGALTPGVSISVPAARALIMAVDAGDDIARVYGGDQALCDREIAAARRLVEVYGHDANEARERGISSHACHTRVLG